MYFMDPMGLFQSAPVAIIAPAPVPPPTPEPLPEPAPEPTEVVTVPPPAAPLPVELPAPTEPEPPPPPLPELQNVVSAFRITGARANDTGGTVMIGTTAYQAGEVADPIHSLTFVGFEDGVMTFRDPRGALYRRRF